MAKFDDFVRYSLDRCHDCNGQSCEQSTEGEEQEMTPSCPKCEAPMQLVKTETNPVRMGCFAFYDVTKVYQCPRDGEIVEKQL